MLRIEKLCLAVGFTHEQTANLMTGKPLPYNGELYSDEHRRKFRTNDVTAKVGTNNGKLIAIWLDNTISDFKRHGKARFYQDSFIEHIDFDYMEIQVIEQIRLI